MTHNIGVNIMFGSVKGLPRLYSFNDAMGFYSKTKGIRGREHIVPLKSNRRDPNAYRIELEKDGGGNIRAVKCFLYRTPVLTYTPDRLTITAWNSITTNQFIEEIAPFWLRAYMKSGQRFWIRGEGEFLPNINGEVTVEVDPETYEPIKGSVKAAKLEAIVLNKTRAAESRKTCKEVVELARVTSKIDGYWTALIESKEIAPDEETAWLRGLLKNGSYRAYARQWRGEGYKDHYFNGSYAKQSAEELLPRVKAYLYQAQYEQDECYDYVPAEYGVVPTTWRYAGGVR